MPEGICSLENMKQLNLNDISLMQLPNNFSRYFFCFNDKNQTKINLLYTIEKVKCTNNLSKKIRPHLIKVFKKSTAFYYYEPQFS